MNILEKLNAKIEKLMNDYESVKFENSALKMELENIKDKNDELVRNNQDMLLKIDSTLTLVKAKENDE